MSLEIYRQLMMIPVQGLDYELRQRQSDALQSKDAGEMARVLRDIIDCNEAYKALSRSRHSRADMPKTAEIVPTSDDKLTQDLLTFQFNERNSGKNIRAINREFFEQNRQKIGRTDVEREKKFATMKRNARRCWERNGQNQ